MANLIDLITSIVSVEKTVSALIAEAKKQIAGEKDRKRRQLLAAAFEKRDLEAIRAILFEVD